MKSFQMINAVINGLQKIRSSFQSSFETPKISQGSFLVILTAAFCLVFIRYLTPFSEFVGFLELLHLNVAAEKLWAFRNEAGDQQLFDLIYWTLCRILFYLIIPMIVISLLLKKPQSEFGWRMSNDLLKDVKIFAVFFCFMLPLVYMVSTQDSFLGKYPFYRLSSTGDIWPNLIIWEAFYFLQFVSLEFFFRGFMVHGLKQDLGDYSVLFMVIPYCMIHFQKPFLETIGAIFAGLILGYLSLRKNSIATGIALHFGVAIAMDVFALYHLGFL
jgi:membrane protease YdiL (CAAX protease family)